MAASSFNDSQTNTLQLNNIPIEDPDKCIKYLRDHVEKTLSDEPTYSLYMLIIDMLEIEITKFPKNALCSIEEFITIVSDLPNEDDNTDSADKKKNLMAEKFNDIIFHASEIINDKTEINEKIEYLTSIPFQIMIESCDIKNIVVCSLSRFIDLLFRHEYFGDIINQEEVENNPRNIPLYTWKYISGYQKARIVFKFRDEPLTLKMHKNVSALMELYEQLMELYEQVNDDKYEQFELPVELYDHINMWIRQNDVCANIKSASKS